MTKVFAFATILVAGAFAAPAAEANPPPKPSKPQPPKQSDVTQVNACGNGAQPYCCNTDNFGKYTTCSALRKLPLCSSLLVLFRKPLLNSFTSAIIHINHSLLR